MYRVKSTNGLIKEKTESCIRHNRVVKLKITLYKPPSRIPKKWFYTSEKNVNFF